MQREIRFRAWDGSEMYSPIIGANGSIYRNDRDYEDGNDAPFDILMQFTGLRDKNGVEIYEGDLVLNTGGLTGEIVFYDYGWLMKWVNLSRYYPLGQEVKVIGNIHDKTTLLEGEPNA